MSKKYTVDDAIAAATITADIRATEQVLLPNGGTMGRICYPTCAVPLSGTGR